MRTQFTEDQALLHKTVKRFFEQEVPIERVRQLQEERIEHDEQLWKKVCQAGWQAITLPEQYGGADADLLELAIVFEEAGKALMPTTFYSTTYATLVLRDAATDAQKEHYFPKLVEGQWLGTVAFEEHQVLNTPHHFSTTATEQHGTWTINGEKLFVQNAASASTVFVIARVDDKYGIFAVAPSQSGVQLAAHTTIGQDFQYVMTFTNVTVQQDALIGGQLYTADDLLATRKQMTALQTVEMAGGCMKVIEQTVDYVSVRKQFNVPIGSFQAVQHHLSNMYTQAEASKLIAYKAVSYVAQGFDATREVSIAKAYVSKAYKDITVMAHQLWGGMGYSTEANLFLWSNRAKATELSFGTESYHRRLLQKVVVEKAKQLAHLAQEIGS